MSFLLLQDGTSKLLLQNGTDRLLLQATDAGGFQTVWTEEDDEDGEADVAMQKNVAGQKVGRQMVSATDGSAFTGAVTVYVTGDAGTQAIGSVGSGACTHEGNGYHTYAPSQAETNYDLIAFTFIGTGAVPRTKEVSTRFDIVDVPNSTAVTAIQDGLATAAQATAIEADTQDLQTQIGTAGAGLTGIPKTGYKLASDGLDVIDATIPSAVATTFPGFVKQLWARMFYKSTLTSTDLITYASDGTTVVTSQTVSDNGTIQTQGKAS